MNDFLEQNRKTFSARVMASPALGNEFLWVGDGVTHSYKLILELI
jgi:hypothetical protein